MKKKLLFAIAVSIISFSSFSQTKGTIKDSRDGKTYKTVKIGNQTWMAENLAYKPNSGEYWAYDNDVSNVIKYGYLYSYKTANEVCPSGWHLPSKQEWENLANYVGKETASEALCTSTGWQWGEANDKYGFSVIPAGTLFTDGNFHNKGEQSVLWFFSQQDIKYPPYLATMAMSKLLFNDNKHVSGRTIIKGASIRCIQN